MKTIYKRTAKGEQEIQKRTYKLDHEHRFVLIMIDGNASAENIVSRSSEQWNPKQCLFELETKGFIENIDADANKASDIGELKQNLIITIQKYLPENNSKVINKILNTGLNKKELLKAIDGGCMFIQLTRSEEIAKVLKQELHTIVGKSNEV
jgi:hypothetical protein